MYLKSHIVTIRLLHLISCKFGIDSVKRGVFRCWRMDCFVCKSQGIFDAKSFLKNNKKKYCRSGL